MRNERPSASNLNAIFLMCVGVFILVINDSIAKTLVERFNPFQILFVRSLIALPVVAFVAGWQYGVVPGLKTKRLRIHLLRALLIIGASYLFVSSLADLPLVEATTLILTAPLFVAALSFPLLGQKVTGVRLASVAIGFLGALAVLQPGLASMHMASLTALGAAVLTALVMMSAAWIDPEEGIWTVALYMNLTAAVACSFALLIDWPPFQVSDFGLFAAMALAGTCGITLITHAFRIGDAATVAPFDYTALLWASFLGWLIFGQLPGWQVYLGAGLIMFAGLTLTFASASSRKASVVR